MNITEFFTNYSDEQSCKDFFRQVDHAFAELGLDLVTTLYLVRRQDCRSPK